MPWQVSCINEDGYSRGLSLLKKILPSSVGSPHHLLPQCVEKDMIRALHYLDGVMSFADGESGAFATSLAASVDGDEEIVASAFHVECDFPFVLDDNRPDVETMRSYRSDGNGVAMGYDDRSPDA